MKLYEIADRYQQILDDAVDHETGEINENAVVLLDEMKSDINEKGIAVASWIKNMEAEHDAVVAARKAMQEREKRLEREREMEWMTGYLQSNMERCGISEISCPYFVIKLKQCPVSVDIIDESSIPADYFREKVTRNVDRVSIRENLVRGIDIPGATLKQNTRIEIR